ncbi:MAG: tRNA preQ1(34) S-adenosylmethionine ribosyltransferase-isomerase QueA [Elusimicrobiota bacterium]|jgi:S-adenosylmethionine:tRNA ribosyltransferase-isomerase|nr:tRNA preQ1(34) S-adenosylmethionine ribosyltransferase-isomerase QueA [Elusimicrobiota bacterium]
MSDIKASDNKLNNLNAEQLDLHLENYFYEIPKSLIAQKPTDKRGDSRLFVLDKKSASFTHKKFSDIIDYFDENDCLIINSAKVAPSRIFGKKATGGKVELLLIKPSLKKQGGNICYEVLLKPALKIGTEIFFETNLKCKVLEKLSDGANIVEFDRPDITDFLMHFGIMPLPPYIDRKSAQELAQLSDFDKQRYQTVYAKTSGAIAAPTAGLHFTKEILNALEKKGVVIADITLLVGWGTFRSITSSQIDQHKMLPESFCIDDKAADIINEALAKNKRITYVGTTSARACESAAKKTGFINERGKFQIKPLSADADIFIYPGYKIKIANRLLTNFHLPCSTPLMLASAFCGRQLLLDAYRKAVDERYRFFSYGDAMFIK